MGRVHPHTQISPKYPRPMVINVGKKKQKRGQANTEPKIFQKAEENMPSRRWRVTLPPPPFTLFMHISHPSNTLFLQVFKHFSPI